MKKFLIYVLFASFVIPWSFIPDAANAAGTTHKFYVKFGGSANNILQNITMAVNNGSSSDKVIFEYQSSPASVVNDSSYKYLQLSSKAYFKFDADVQLGMYTDYSVIDPSKMKCYGFVLWNSKTNTVTSRTYGAGAKAIALTSSGTDSFVTDELNSLIAVTVPGKTFNLNATQGDGSGGGTPDLGPITPGVNGFDTAKAVWNWSYDSSGGQYAGNYVMDNYVNYVQSGSITKYQFHYVSLPNTYSQIDGLATDKKRGTGGQYWMKLGFVQKYNIDGSQTPVTISAIAKKFYLYVGGDVSPFPARYPIREVHLSDNWQKTIRGLYFWSDLTIANANDYTYPAVITCTTNTPTGNHKIDATAIAEDIEGQTNTFLNVWNWLNIGSPTSTADELGAKCMQNVGGIFDSKATTTFDPSGNSVVNEYIKLVGKDLVTTKPIAKETYLPAAAVAKCSKVGGAPDFDAFVKNFQTFMTTVITKSGATGANMNNLTGMLNDRKADIVNSPGTIDYINQKFYGLYSFHPPAGASAYPNEPFTYTKLSFIELQNEMAKLLVFGVDDAEFRGINVLKFITETVPNTIDKVTGGNAIIKFGIGALAALGVVGLTWTAVSSLNPIAIVGDLVVAGIYATMKGINASHKQYYDATLKSAYAVYLGAKQSAFQGCVIDQGGLDDATAQKTGFTKSILQTELTTLQAAYTTIAGDLIGASDDWAKNNGVDANGCP
ncbi:MAG: hypothetical protein NTW50_01575, partial [Candidatus Berkelbacteria bacterium]|nr:hypothetical protein [Candidatus Berkelbacteria bacterium]